MTTYVKYISALILAGAVSVNAFAQNYLDVLEFGRNNYYGSARSMGIGNAVTALGGEVGMIGINPAAGAVAPYSQVSLTGGANISFDIAEGMNRNSVTNTQACIPNIGVSLNFDTGNSSGLVSVSLGFLMNASTHYAEKSGAYGIQDKTSIAGWMACRANGIPSSIMDDSDLWYNNDDWISNVAYRGSLISTLGPLEDCEYIGCTETLGEDGKTISIPGNLYQELSRATNNIKRDYIFNLGFNFGDTFYAGLNLGITQQNYNFSQSFKEEACLDSEGTNPFRIEYKEDGETKCTYFESLNYNQKYQANMAGFYFKLGMIYTPTDNLRLGLAYQAPTRFSLAQSVSYLGSSDYSDNSWNNFMQSPNGKDNYYFVSPSRFNFGIAGTIAGRLLLSADYELTNYSWSKFKDSDSVFRFEYVNNDIKELLSFEHSVRAGAEFHATESFAIRAGYNILLGGEKDFRTMNDQVYSLGLGYSSDDSFYADIAAKATNYRDTYIHPYGDYNPDAFSPEIKLDRWLFGVVATIGFRF